MAFRTRGGQDINQMTPTKIMTHKGQLAVRISQDQDGKCFTIKTVQSNQKLHSPPAIAYDVDVIKRAEALGVHYHVVIDAELNCKWSVDHALFMKHQELMNRKHGWQFMLAMKFWTLGDTPASQTAEVLEENIQLDLFGDDMERAA